MTKDTRVTVRLTAEERDGLQAIADQEERSLGDVVRRAIRAFLAVAAVLVTMLMLTACGSSAPPSAPVQTVAPSPAAQLQEPAAEPSAAESEACWTDPNIGNPHWAAQFDELSGDPVRAVAMLDDLPDPSEGCGPAEVASLEYAQEVAENMRERFPDLFN